LNWRVLALWCRLGLLVPTAAACGTAPPPTMAEGSLPPGQIAGVGPDAVTDSLLQRAAAAGHTSLEQALQGIASDLLFGLEAERVLPSGVVQQIERAGLARALLERVKLEEQPRGALSAADRNHLMERLWLKVDRPPSVRVTHAVVLLDAANKREVEAKAVAEAIRLATAGATTSVDFIAKSQAVPVGKFSVRTESLPPVTADGRVVNLDTANQPGDPSQRFELAFARAASALSSVGQQSEVIRSSYGFHVIRLDEKLPAFQLPPAEAQAILNQALTTERTAERLSKLTAPLNPERTVQLERSARELLGKITLEP